MHKRGARTAFPKGHVADRECSCGHDLERSEDMRKQENNLQPSEPRRGDARENEAYLRLVGERVRNLRAQLGMARKALSQASGVSERYLAELERGTGNASLLVLRNIASALGARIEDLASEQDDQAVDTSLGFDQLEQLSPSDASPQKPVRRWNTNGTPLGRIALVGLRGAGKTTLGHALAKAIGVPCIALDREIERASGMEVADVLAVHGEAVYRRLERNCLATVVETVPRAVIKTGGGIVLEPETMDLMFSGCFVIWITASSNELFARARGSAALPINGSGRHAKAVLEAALAEREPLYARADAVIDTTGKSVDEALSELLRIVQAAQPRENATQARSTTLDRLKEDRRDIECAS